MAPPSTREKYHVAIARVVKRVPKGRVASYNQVAIMAGYPRTARFVGRALQLAHGLPWWRIIASDGRIVIMNPELRREQVDALAAEGIVPGPNGKIDIDRFSWRPRVTPPRTPLRLRSRRPG